MKALANLSIRNKLVGIILVSTLLSVLGGFAMAVAKSQQILKENLIESTELVARAVADYNALYLYMETPDDAERDTRDFLREIESVTEAYIFDMESPEPVAKYAPSGEIHLPERLDPPRTDTSSDEFVDVYEPVLRRQEGKEPVRLGTLYLRASTEGYRREVRNTRLYMGGLLLAVLFLAAFFGYLLQGVISNPILYLAEMAQRISTNADYTIRVPKPGKDEIGVLYDGFNDMLEQIQKRQEDLERSNRDLDQFAYVASHDLKAPLRAIATLSGWIEEDLQDKLSPEASDQMRLLRSRVQRMDGLIEGILQYSRVGRMDSHGERVDVDRMLGEIVEFLAPPDGFKVEIAPEMPILVTKRLRLEQVFSNLINNAIKYHDREDGRVDVTVRRSGRFFEFSVADDGPGIAEEHHDKVFMMFQTLQPRDQVESTGLGLSLVKKLVEEEGGTVSLSSEVGKGAVFRFTWPAAVEGVSSEEQPS